LFAEWRGVAVRTIRRKTERRWCVGEWQRLALVPVACIQILPHMTINIPRTEPRVTGRRANPVSNPV